MRYTYARAVEIMKEDKGKVTPHNEIFKAIVDGKLPQYYLNKLVSFRAYSNDLPGPRLVGEWHPHYPLMKCRGNVITAISLAIQGAVEQGLIDDERIISLINDFRHYKWNVFEGKYTSWTTSEEIKFMNDTLDVVINHLCDKYGLKKPEIDFATLLAEQRRE